MSFTKEKPKNSLQKQREATLHKELFKAIFVDGDGLNNLDYTQIAEMIDICRKITEKSEIIKADYEELLQRTHVKDTGAEECDNQSASTRKTSDWIPVRTRPLTDAEYKKYEKCDNVTYDQALFMDDQILPEVWQEVWVTITNSCGITNVVEARFEKSGKGFPYFRSNYTTPNAWIKAWKPRVSPEPYNNKKS